MKKIKLGHVMIIIWKWEELIKNNLLSKVFFVEGSKKKKRVIAVNQEYPNEEIHQLLATLIKELIDENKIYLFFHREKFEIKDLERVLALGSPRDLKERRLKSFRIAGGQDYIYYSTQNEGLLDNTGRLMYNPKKTDIITNTKGKLVRVPAPVKVYIGEQGSGKEIKIIAFHFNNVWDYYEHEYAKKIGELQSNLIKILVDLENPLNNDKKYPCSHWAARIKKDAYSLHLQIGSLLKEFDETKVQELSYNHEIDQIQIDKQKIKAQEITEETSLTFDDVNVYMEAATSDLKASYANLSGTLELFHETGSEQGKVVSFQELNHKFNEVLKILYSPSVAA